MVQVYIIVKGRVQGVNFRYYVLRKANELGINGYVRNLKDGDVEILAQGTRDSVDRLIEFIKGNPGSSFVTDMELTWEKPETYFSNFQIKL